MSNTLQAALLRALRNSLDKSPDRFVRVALSPDYPLEDTLNQLFLADKHILIGLLSPYKNSKLFKQPKFPIEHDAAVLTELRNSRNVDSKPIILVGLAIGAEESGLRDLAIVLTEDGVAREWKTVTREMLRSRDQNHDSKVRGELADQVISKISKGEANPATRGR